MNFRLKAILLATTGVAGIFLAIWTLNHWIVQPAFNQLEQAHALENGGRARGAIQTELRQLRDFVSDWAVWDDAYAFAENRDPAFVQVNLSDWRQLEKNARLNVALILNRAGQVLYVDGYDTALGGKVSLTAFSGEQPAILAMLGPVLDRDQTLEGILPTEHGLLLVAAHSILTTQGTGPARGVLVFGRFLDAPLLRSLDDQVQVSFELFPKDDPRLSAEEREYLRNLRPGTTTLQPGPNGTLFAYQTLAGLAGQPVALLRVPLWMEISATAQRAGRTLIEILGLTTLGLLLGGAYFFSRPGRGSASPGGMVAWVTATLTALIGLTLTVGLFLELRQRSQDVLERRFQLIAVERAGFLIERFRNTLRYLDTVKHFFDASETVSREEFQQFVTPILDYGGFRAIEWLPRVAWAQRAGFETAARQEGLTNFQFTELDSSGTLVRAAERDEYFPVYYLEPQAGNQKALGYSPAPPHPARGAALSRARDSGQIALTERYILVQEPEQQFSVLAFAPVYEGRTALDVEERRRRLKGFVLGVIRIGDLIEKGLDSTRPQGLILRLTDLSAEEDQRLLYASIPRLGSPQPVSGSALHYRQDFSLADRWWRIEIQPNAAFLANNTEPTYRWIPVSGVLLTALASLYLFTVVSQRRRAEALVTARTAELRASQEYTRAVLDSLNDAVFVSDGGATRILDVNRRMSELYGYDREEALTLNIEQLSLGTPPYALDDALKWLRKARNEGPQTFEWIARTRARAMLWVEVSIRFAVIGDQNRFVITIREITERKKAEQALRESEDTFRNIVENAPLGFHLYRLNGDDRLVFVGANPGADTILKVRNADFVGKTIEEAFPPLAHTEIPATYRRLAREGGVYRWDSVDYRDRAIAGAFEVTAFQTTPTVIAVAFTDITERRRAEERQRLAAAVFESAREAIVVTNTSGYIVAANPAATALSGYSEAEMLGLSPRRFQSARQSEVYYDALRQTVAREGSWQGEIWSRRKDGKLFLLLTTVSEVRDTTNQVTHYVIMATDITHQKEAEQRIEHLAYYDALTDLPNRALLAQRAELALALAARRREELAVMFLDLDRFKEVNDSLGHAEGDELLVQVATWLRHLMRETDTVCRLGGDEFVLLLPDTGQPGASRLAEKLMAAFRQPCIVAGHSLRVTTSIGIALYPHDGATFAELLKNADAALYQAKQEGRDNWMFYAREMNVATFERLMLESQLRKAIGTGQLRAYFQPKVRLSDGRLTGAEALIRWLHPDQGLILPGRFIPVAEASDLIVELGDWMLAEVCQQLTVWRGAGLPLLTVSVNLAARHFRDPGFVGRIGNLLVAHGLAASALELELTESSLLEAGARTAETLLALKRLGVGLSIDDFGTGYSSLGYLKRLPLTALKIDQSFVRDLVTDPDDRILATTIIALGHSLGLKVVAEGVETEEQRRILLEQGCDLAQGYLFDAPMPAERFAQWLTPATTAGD